MFNPFIDPIVVKCTRNRDHRTDGTAVSLHKETHVFYRVFGPKKATQMHLYRESAKPIVSDVLGGSIGTVIAYGQVVID